jgi:hypothetical protein
MKKNTVQMSSPGLNTRNSLETRYARVKAILDGPPPQPVRLLPRAGRFWDLLLDKLKEAKICGARLIAPAQMFNGPPR